MLQPVSTCYYYTDACMLPHMTKRAAAQITVPPPIKPRRIQTTLVLTEELWRAVKIRAVDERTDLRDICTRALETYLKTPLPERY
jgi:hypothetical protein